jgi:predicted phage baseplate assembly protein
VDGLLVDRPVAITGKRQRLRITELALNPVLILEGGERVDLQPGDLLSFAAPPLKLSELRLGPLSPAEFGNAIRDSLSLFSLRLIDRDGRSGAAVLLSSAFVLEPAAETDEAVREIAFIDNDATTAIVHDRDRTTLQLVIPLANVYDRATVRINANVAAATHGESVQELLGSGDAAMAYQSFTLSQRPLTYIGADVPSGSASTLKVYVNDVLWQPAPFFYGRGASEPIYVTQRDDEGRTTVRFGDGINGARLPTGQNNVRAEYRKGTGLGGLVGAGKLSQLLSRPLGLKEVVNPVAAEGAEDPESRDDARKNAPTTVLTLDRAVSLQDYEDFARTFAGIAKAQAVWVWDGRSRAIFLTVAGADGEVFAENGPVIAKLKTALREFGDPYVAFTIKSFRKVLFQIQGKVTVDSNHVAETVMAAVMADLRQRYSFDARGFGQPVALSEAIAAIQSVPGVAGVDIDKFHRNDTPTPASKARLDADRPAMGADGTMQAAELLLLDESALNQLGARQ